MDHPWPFGDILHNANVLTDPVRSGAGEVMKARHVSFLMLLLGIACTLPQELGGEIRPDDSSGADDDSSGADDKNSSGLAETSRSASPGTDDSDGSNTTDIDQEEVIDPIAPATTFSAGPNHSCAVSVGGQVRCWGFGDGGALGYGNTNSIGDDELPIAAGDVDVGGPVSAISVNTTTCALLTTGAVRCWGTAQTSAVVGLLGYPGEVAIGDDETPAEMGDIDLGGRAVQVSAGGSHNCALLDTGAVRCWGDGAVGALGYGNPDTIGDDETPAMAGDVPVGGKVVQISAGAGRTCALLIGGTVRCWGAGVLGYLGGSNSIVDAVGDDETPAEKGDIDVGGEVVQISAGDFHVCALLREGTVRCWGDSVYGQLGYGNPETIGDDETPASAGDVPIGGVATLVSAQGIGTCAVLDNGGVRCWGSVYYGVVAEDAILAAVREPLHEVFERSLHAFGDDEFPSDLPLLDFGGAVSKLDLGSENGCAELTTGGLRCWGRNFWGEGGHGHTQNIGDDEPPSSAPLLTIF